MRRRPFLTVCAVALFALPAWLGCAPKAEQAAAPAMNTASNEPAPPPPPPPTVKLSGQVTAPAGLLAQPAPKKTSWRLDDLFVTRAEAFVGVSAAAGVSVSLCNSDAYAQAVGEPIVVGQADASGNFALVLPPTVEPGPSLFVRVGDSDGYLRRMVTGTTAQDVNLNTEIGLRVVLAHTGTYPVDVRQIPGPQFEKVYTTVGHDFNDFDVRPILAKNKGARNVIFEKTCTAVVAKVKAKPATWSAVGDTVKGSYETARQSGHGVLTVTREGKPITIKPDTATAKATGKAHATGDKSKGAADAKAEKAKAKSGGDEKGHAKGSGEPKAPGKAPEKGERSGGDSGGEKKP